MRLVTPRLVLRNFIEADLAREWAPLKPVAAAVQPFDLRDLPAVKRQVHDAIATCREEPRTTWDLAVVVSEGERLIGRAGLKRGEREPREALMWFVSDPSSWNQGYAHEALTALLGAAFGPLKLHRVTAETSPGNAGAVGLFESLGLRREAHFVENAFAGGRWVDTALYATLDREWAARPKP
ncbi:MAG: GNAT family N-acetyltransferase [Myxococcales bacterium]|nr:GNAT family N-acetyltransferase [Myxococcales bacterium]